LRPVEASVGIRGTGVTLRVGPAERMEAGLGERRGRVLMAVRYGGPGGGLRDGDHPLVEIPNPVLSGAPLLEIWETQGRAAGRRRGDLAWAEDGRKLFGCLYRHLLNDIEESTLETYREMLALLEERGYPCLQRVWNYVPRINEEQRGLERYKLFNAGRARAFEERFRVAAERHFSASSAVGTIGDAFIVCFAAGREPGTHVENPRQVSAYRYPPDYGLKHPCFARGTVAPAAWGGAFFLSGTASVVGHQTMHPGDPLGQLEETLTNIAMLLDGAAAHTGRRRLDVARFNLFKVYVRSREHFPAIRGALARRLDSSTPAVYLLADICRADLQLEIEGVCL